MFSYHNDKRLFEGLKPYEPKKYECHKWYVCDDLKVVGVILGLQSGYTKYCSRQDHYKRKFWSVRNEYIPGKMNVKNSC